MAKLPAQENTRSGGDIQPPLDLPGGWPPHLQTYVMWGLASLIQGYNCVGVKLY